jgi:D-beta-D-heptose 7-phosphate kinase/D-beta-D-heptose 1-phosphate adenosyltransferase
VSWVLVLGDAMLDRYTTGQASRCSPEAPVPVLVARDTFVRPGGAANVAANLQAMGVRTRFFGRHGPDEDAKLLYAGLQAAGVQAQWWDTPCKTQVKHRFLAGQQLLRVDHCDDAYDSATMQAHILAEIARLLTEQPAAVVVSDYCKGTLDGMRRQISDLCASAAVPLFLDTKPKALAEYHSVFLLKPNLREAEQMAGQLVHPGLYVDDPVSAGTIYAEEILKKYPTTAAVCVTLGAHGAVLAASGLKLHVYAAAAAIADPTGAGDTFLAALVAGIVGARPITDAAERAVLAGAMAVGLPGTQVIGGDDIEDALLEERPERRVMTPVQVAAFAARRRRQGKTIGFANGCFDLVHPGHVHLLTTAKQRCDVLIVAINSDASVRRLKGELRPLTPPGGMRAQMLLPYADAIVEFDEDTPLALIKALHPQFLFKGEEYLDKLVVGADEVAKRGGEVVFVPTLPNFSTTAVAEALRGIPDPV